MIDAVIALALNSDPVISARHPDPASPWVQSVEANCGNTVLLINGYGAGRPLNRTAELRVNGQSVIGNAVGRLLGDLSQKRAVYRFEILCGDPREMTVRINMGEKQLGGPVRYQVASAFLRDNRLVSYSGLEESNTETFWFR